MQQELTRREALKRGALVAGGLAWATPVVQAVGMRPAFAQVPSPGEEIDCCVGPDGKTTKLASLTMEYLAGTNFCSESDFTQDTDLVTCIDFPSPPSPVEPLPDPAFIVASHQANIFGNDGTFPKPAARIWFEGPVAANSSFLIDATTASETSLKGETWIHIFAGDEPIQANYRQKLAFHTSCSEPLITGDQFGCVVLVGCTPDTTPEPSELEDDAEQSTGGDLSEEELTDVEEGFGSKPSNEPPENPGQGPKEPENPGQGPKEPENPGQGQTGTEPSNASSLSGGETDPADPVDG